MVVPAALDLYPPGVRLIGGRRRAPIRGVLHDVAGFSGIAERGPVASAVRVESVEEFERVFGGPVPEGFLAPSVHLFFDNGGRAAWIVRVAHAETMATARLFVTRDGFPTLRVEAASPGRWGNCVRVRIEPTSPEEFTLRVNAPGRAEEVWPGLSLGRLADPDTRPAGLSSLSVSLEEPPVAPATFGRRAGGVSVLRTAPVAAVEKSGNPTVISFDNLSPHEAQLAGGRDGLGGLNAEDFGTDTARPVGLKVLEEVDEVALLALPDLVWQAPLPISDVPEPPSFRCEDYFTRGAAPVPPEPEPDPLSPEPRRPLTLDEQDRLRREMVAQARRQRDRFAILDSAHPSDLRCIFDDGNPDPGDQRMTDGEFGAIYFPWIKTSVTGINALLPPSGAMAGIFARTTLRDGPQVAPANERLEKVTGLAYHVSDTEHALLNAARVNVLRSVPGRGLRPMGARTRRKDGPFRQIAIRRLVNFIVETLDEETQWLVFEPNDSDTRGELERAVRGLLDRIWRQGMLDGARPEEAYSLSAGPAVNPPDSIAAGRLVCECAFRPPWPAEWLRVRLVRGEGGLELAGLDTGASPDETREA